MWGVAVGYGGVMRRQGVAQEVEGAYPNLGSKVNTGARRERGFRIGRGVEDDCGTRRE